MIPTTQHDLPAAGFHTRVDLRGTRRPHGNDVAADAVAVAMRHAEAEARRQEERFGTSEARARGVLDRLDAAYSIPPAEREEMAKMAAAVFPVQVRLPP